MQCIVSTAQPQVTNRTTCTGRDEKRPIDGWVRLRAWGRAYWCCAWGDHTGNKVGFAPDLLISLRCFAAAIGGVSAACRLVPARPPFTSCTALDSGVVLTLYRAAVHCFSPSRTALTASLCRCSISSLCRCSISISSSPSSRVLRRARWVG